MATELYALHGFLGGPKDWDILKGLPYHALDLFENNEIVSLEKTAENINKLIRLKKKKDSKIYLLGYSLGGRIALHAALQQPDLYDGVILVSTHPGLSSNKERIIRLKSDFSWAKKFEIDPWSSLMDEWNNQLVFKNSHFYFDRYESEFKRPQLASALRLWSLGRQKDLRKKISEWGKPILWMNGDKDHLCKAIAETIKLKHKLSSISLVANASHRLPWEFPEEFSLRLQEFLNIKANKWKKYE